MCDNISDYFRVKLCIISVDIFPSFGRSDGAMVLGKRSVPSRPTNLDNSQSKVYRFALDAEGGCLDIIFSHLSFPFSDFVSLEDSPI